MHLLSHVQHSSRLQGGQATVRKCKQGTGSLLAGILQSKEGKRGPHRHGVLQLVEELVKLVHVVAGVQRLIAEVVSKACECFRHLCVATC